MNIGVIILKKILANRIQQSFTRTSGIYPWYKGTIQNIQINKCDTSHYKVKNKWNISILTDAEKISDKI